MKELYITGGVVLVDDEDYMKLSQFKWHMQGNYAVHSKSSQEHVTLHRLIMADELSIAPKNTQIDHADGDKLNNQRHNLRICTPSQNVRNCRNTRIKKHSKFRGVSMNHGKYCVYIHTDIKHKFIGRYDSEYTAAIAYDVAAKEYHGEFATLNFPQFNKSCS